MNSNVFSRNLRSLRLAKGMTQEQAAEGLGVSPQSVSRWECGTTLPDVLLLPELARMYGVTVDDLYRQEAQAYPSYAQRLLAVYEASGRTEDFLAAEQEFSRLAAPSPDDLRAWGVLYHYMTKSCAAHARQKLEQAIVHPKAEEWVRHSAAQQKIALMCDLGQGREATAMYDRLRQEQPWDYQAWLLCAAAHAMAGEPEAALVAAQEGLVLFPGKPLLHLYAGDSCRALKQYEEAFSHWHQALELDASCLDARYAIADCREELGQYSEAQTAWAALARELRNRGMDMESKYPAQRAESCVRRVGV